MAAVIRRLVGQQALTNRDVGAGACRHVEEHEIAAAPEHARLRDHVVVARGVEVLHREVHTAQLSLRVEIHAAPCGERTRDRQERRARAAVEDAARIHVIGLIGQHEHGAVVRELGDGDAETLGEGRAREQGARVLDVSRRHRDGSYYSGRHLPEEGAWP